jgi:hypothetical protein
MWRRIKNERARGRRGDEGKLSMGVWEYGSMGVWEYGRKIESFSLPHSHTPTHSHIHTSFLSFASSPSLPLVNAF